MTAPEKLDNILSKLSLKGMNCQPARGSLKPDTAPFAIARIFGQAKKHDLVVTSFGDSERIIGDFEGINLATGEVFKSTKMFLPSVISEIMVNALDAAEAGDAALEFALEIGVQYSEKSSTGYAYTVKPLIKTAARDALAHLRETVTASLPQLAAPAAAAKPASDKPANGDKKK